MKIDGSTLRSIADVLEARKPDSRDEVEAVYYPSYATAAAGDTGGGGGGRGRGRGRGHGLGRADPKGGPPSGEITRDTVQRMLKYLGNVSNGYKAVPGTPQQTVDVSLQGPNLRFTLDAPFAGPAIPQRGSKKVQLREVIRKERVRPPVGFPEFRLRFNLKREVLIPEDDDTPFNDPLVAGPTRGAEYARTYRHKKRWSFVPVDSDKSFRIDITAVRQLTQSDRGEQPATYSDILKSKERYEAEVEYTGKDALKGAAAIAVAKAMLGHCIVLLKVIDDTDHLLSISEQSAIVAQYTSLVGTPKFVGPKPATLELVHLACNDSIPGIPCVTRDYTVTDKADGERRLLLVSDEGRIFTINDRMFVRDTGRSARSLKRCLLDGEHLPDRFLVFDTMFYNGNDVRDLPLKLLTDESNGGTSKPKPKPARRRTGGSGGTQPDRLSAARSVVSDLLADEDDDYGINVKEFMDARSAQSMAEACRHILLKKTTGRLKYEVDGLIFTPASLPMPHASVRWLETLKWKPPSQNTIDFQVRFHADSELSVVNHRVPHRIADLLVGQDPWLAKQLTTLEMISGQAQDRLERGGSYAAVPFSPKVTGGGGDSTEPIHVCYLKMNATGRIQCRSGEEIIDGAVVEFAFDSGTTASSGMPRPCRWIPLRVRWDKTERHFTTGDITANNWEAAESVWRTILNPITEETLTNPEVAANAIEKLNRASSSSSSSEAESSNYYVAQLRSADGYSGGLRKFHNYWVKKESLLAHFTASKGLGRSVFDFGCGQAGDLNKWIDMGANRIMGVDKYASNLYDPSWSVKPSANVRLLKARGWGPGRGGRAAGIGDQGDIRKARAMKIVFLPMDASMPIHSQAYIDSLEEGSGDRSVARCLWGLDPIAAVTPPPLKEYHGFASNAFDLATCMFAIHYFFEKPENLATFCNNVATVLRAGGHFVGCCLDGEAVDELLNAEAPKIGDVVRHNKDKDKDSPPAWSITRRYSAGRLRKAKNKNKAALDDDASGRFGRRIDVYMESIGQEMPEYLVDYGDLVDAMEEHGLRPVDASEASALGLCGGKGTGMFEDLFEDMQSKHSRGGGERHPSIAAALAMTPDERRYSFLNRWFVFVRA